MNAITNIYDAATGRIHDPVMFMAADADIKRHVIATWGGGNARAAPTFPPRWPPRCPPLGRTAREPRGIRCQRPC